MFPAGAGMNRLDALIAETKEGVPRRRGDEPAMPEVYDDMKPCSPQARG